MTTIKDYLRSMIKDYEEKRTHAFTNDEEDLEEVQEEIVDEYIDIIAKRIVGAE